MQSGHSITVDSGTSLNIHLQCGTFHKPRHVLILGGNGRTSRLLTVMLLEKGWTVTSLIRSPDQIDDLKKIGRGLPGKHDVVVQDLEKISSTDKAKKILDEVKPDSLVFAAVAGAEGGQDKVFRIDRDAAANFLRASLATPSVTHYLMISYLGSRRACAPWWTAADWAGWQKVNSTFMARYYEPKVQADEILVTEARRRDDFSAVSVRPGGLWDKPEGGVLMGQTRQARGMTTRATVARMLAVLLEQRVVRGSFLDVLDGEDDLRGEVERCVRDGVECAEGEPYYQK